MTPIFRIASSTIPQKYYIYIGKRFEKYTHIDWEVLLLRKTLRNPAFHPGYECNTKLEAAPSQIITVTSHTASERALSNCEAELCLA